MPRTSIHLALCLVMSSLLACATGREHARGYGERSEVPPPAPPYSCDPALQDCPPPECPPGEICQPYAGAVEDPGAPGDEDRGRGSDEDRDRVRPRDRDQREGRGREHDARDRDRGRDHDQDEADGDGR